MTKKEILELIESRKLQLQDVLNLPSPALPILHQNASRRKANASDFLKQLTDLKSQLESLENDDVHYVQPHNLRQYLRSADSYEYKLKESYCQFAIVHGTVNLIAISRDDFL